MWKDGKGNFRGGGPIRLSKYLSSDRQMNNSAKNHSHPYRRVVTTSGGEDVSRHVKSSSRVVIKKEVDEDEDYEEDSHKPKIQSSVVSTKKDTRTRTEIIKAQNGDGRGKYRNRRMFGFLMNTLSSFRKEKQDNKLLTRQEERKMEIEKKIEEQSLEDRKKNQEVRKKLFEERRKEQKKINLLEYKVQLNEESKDWKEQWELKSKFIMTKAQPPIFYFPNDTTGRTKRSHISSKQRIEEIIENSQESMNATNRDIDEEIDMIYRPVQKLVAKEATMRQTSTEKKQDDDLEGNEPAENMDIAVEDIIVEVEKKENDEDDGEVSGDKEIKTETKHSASSDEESGDEVESSEVAFVEKESEDFVEKIIKVEEDKVEEDESETEVEKPENDSEIEKIDQVNEREAELKKQDSETEKGKNSETEQEKVDKNIESGTEQEKQNNSSESETEQEKVDKDSEVNTEFLTRPELKVQDLVAVRAIAKGSEITLSYMPALGEGSGDADTRKAYLREWYGFNCVCVACSKCIGDADRRDVRKLQQRGLDNLNLYEFEELVDGLDRINSKVDHREEMNRKLYEKAVCANDRVLAFNSLSSVYLFKAIKSCPEMEGWKSAFEKSQSVDINGRWYLFPPDLY